VIYAVAFDSGRITGKQEVTGLGKRSRPSARIHCEPTGRTQTIHWKWAPHRLTA